MGSIRKRYRSGTQQLLGYQAQFRVKGAKSKSKTYPTHNEAKLWLAKQKLEYDEKKSATPLSPEPTPVKHYMVGEAIDRFLRELPEGKSTRNRDLKSILPLWKEKLGEVALKALSKDDINPVIEGFSKTVRGAPGSAAPATVRRKVAMLSLVFQAAIKDWEDGWLDKSPLERMRLPKIGRNERVRYLNEAERTALFRACKASQSTYLYTVVVLAISTGMRLGEILGLRWELLDIGHERLVGHAQLLKTKNDDTRGVPIADHALELLRELKATTQRDTGYVFVGPNKGADGEERAIDIRRPWRVALKLSGIQNFHFHDLRHCAASYLVMGGVPLLEVAEILGHRTLAMTKRYAHLSSDHTAKVVARMNQKLFSTEV